MILRFQLGINFGSFCRWSGSVSDFRRAPRDAAGSGSGQGASDEHTPMKDEEPIARFIHLRADGWTFARIATELNVSKPTLVDWGRQFQFEIQNLRSVEIEALAEKCFTGRQKRSEQLSRG